MPDSTMNEEYKKTLCKKLASNLPTLRMKAGMTQTDLAVRLGYNRQTIGSIEGNKRDMFWSTFAAIVLYFSANEELKQLMITMGIINDDVEKFLNINLRNQ